MTIKSLQNAVPWCCRHRWTMRYIACVVSVELILQILQIRGVI